MPRKFYKHRLLLDEGFHLPKRLPILNSRFSLKHIVKDYNKGGITDDQVYNLAQKENRLVITYNIKDFMNFAMNSKRTGIIGISTNLTVEQIDKKLTALLMRSSQKSLYGKLTVISGENTK